MPDQPSGNKRRLLAQFPYFVRALKLVWAAARKWTLWWAFLLLLQGLLPVVIVYLSRDLVNLIAAVVKGATGEVRSILLLVLLIAAVQICSEVLRVAIGWIRQAQAELMRDHINNLIHRKSVEVDLAFYESSEFYDHLFRARADATYRPIQMLESTGNFAQSTITLVAMAAVLLRFGVWLPFALLVSTIPALLVALRFNLQHHEWRRKSTMDERRTLYYDWVLTMQYSATELRLFGLGNYFISLYQSLRERLRTEFLALMKRQSTAELVAGITGYLASGGAIAWIVWKTVRGVFTLGDLALFYQAFQQGQRLMRSVLENLGQIYSNSLFLGNLFEFLELKPQVVDPVIPVAAPEKLQNSICFNDVTFRYPGSSRFTLRNFHLTIGAGEIVAVVGPNGAGKSTLIKLICRLYDPEGGSVELDGIDIRNFRVDDLHAKISALFQEPVHYASTARENIVYGDLAQASDQQSIEHAAAEAGAAEVIAHLPKQYETLLGDWFAGGLELSVGEWQRIALARAFLRKAPIILLDEPTSAMDSWAEAEWMKRFRRLANGRTALIITHRFTTAMQADRIHVMHEGQIVESGHHSELVRMDGLYAQSWNAQTQSFRVP